MKGEFGLRGSLGEWRESESLLRGSSRVEGATVNRTHTHTHIHTQKLGEIVSGSSVGWSCTRTSVILKLKFRKRNDLKGECLPGV